MEDYYDMEFMTDFDSKVFNHKDLDKKVDYYLKNDEKRKELAKKGRELVLKNHTFDSRVLEILSVLKNEAFYHFIEEF